MNPNNNISASHLTDEYLRLEHKLKLGGGPRKDRKDP